MKRAYFPVIGSSLGTRAIFSWLMLVVCIVFAGCTACNVAVAGCGSQHDPSWQWDENMASRGLTLATKMEYLRGEVTVSTIIPRKDCHGPGCRSNKGIESKSDIGWGFRANSNSVKTCSESISFLFDSPGRFFEAYEAGNRAIRFPYLLEHPPKRA